MITYAGYVGMLSGQKPYGFTVTVDQRSKHNIIFWSSLVVVVFCCCCFLLFFILFFAFFLLCKKEVESIM